MADEQATATKDTERKGTPTREYVVLREFNLAEAFETSDELIDELRSASRTGTVLVEIGDATAPTSAKARRVVAERALDQAELERGVSLRAVTRTAFDSGWGTMRVSIETRWRD